MEPEVHPVNVAGAGNVVPPEEIVPPVEGIHPVAAAGVPPGDVVQPVDAAHPMGVEGAGENVPPGVGVLPELAVPPEDGVPPDVAVHLQLEAPPENVLPEEQFRNTLSSAPEYNLVLSDYDDDDDRMKRCTAPSSVVSTPAMSPTDSSSHKYDLSDKSAEMYLTNPNNTAVKNWSEWQGYPLPAFRSHDCQRFIRLQNGEYICGCNTNGVTERAHSV